MGILSLVGRVDQFLRRRQDLAPIAEAVRARLWEGNALAVLAGQSPDGTPVAPLTASTLKRRKGTGPPRAPFGRDSRVIKGFVVTVTITPGELRFVGAWPAFTPIIEYLSDGTPRMAARPTFGFRQVDLEWVREVRRRHNLEGGR